MTWFVLLFVWSCKKANNSKQFDWAYNLTIYTVTTLQFVCTEIPSMSYGRRQQLTQGAFLLFPLPSHFLPFHGEGSTVRSPAGSGAEPRPKMNLVHSRAVRKPLVAITFEYCEVHVLQQNDQNLALAVIQYLFTYQQYRDGVSQSPKGEWWSRRLQVS